MVDAFWFGVQQAAVESAAGSAFSPH